MSDTDHSAGSMLQKHTADDHSTGTASMASGVAHSAAGPSEAARAQFRHNPHYLAIVEHYGDRRAARSGVLYIRHIDEGLWVLDRIEASIRAKEAYCLHPLVQHDDELCGALGDPDHVLGRHAIDARSLAVAMEYRAVANAYLSRREIASIDEIALGPLEDVRDMLIADKVQNRKDFERYHRDTHPRADALAAYFANWLRRLGISEARYRSLVLGLEVAHLSRDS